MLTNSDGNVLKLIDYTINQNDVYVGYLVYPTEKSLNGLTPFEKTLNLRVSLGNDFREELAKMKGSTDTLIETSLKNLFEDEIRAQAEVNPDKFTINNQVKGDWK